VLYGFTKRMLWSAWAVAAIGQTTLLVLADRSRDAWSFVHDATLVLGVVGFLLGMVGVQRLREAARNDVVTAAIVVAANTFGFALLVVAWGVAVDGERGATYDDMLRIVLAAFAGLLIAFHHRRRRQLLAAAAPAVELERSGAGE
jgi:hypothetical protein